MRDVQVNCELSNLISISIEIQIAIDDRDRGFDSNDLEFFINYGTRSSIRSTVHFASERHDNLSNDGDKNKNFCLTKVANFLL